MFGVYSIKCLWLEMLYIVITVVTNTNMCFMVYNKQSLWRLNISTGKTSELRNTNHNID